MERSVEPCKEKSIFYKIEPNKMLRHGSLFSGIGGFDLAAELVGWFNAFHCEFNPFGQRILKYYWPQSESYGDIKKTDFTKHKGTIDIISGGFPCQPYSVAGKRKGKEDDRHLWPEMLRAIREVQPRWVVGENVRGLINWNGGMVFDEVQADLEAIGYEVIPFILPACGVNAPHRRDRVWFIAYCAHYGSGKRETIPNEQRRDDEIRGESFGHGDGRNVTDPNSPGLQTQGTEQQPAGTTRGGIQRAFTDTGNDGLFTTENRQSLEERDGRDSSRSDNAQQFERRAISDEFPADAHDTGGQRGVERGGPREEGAIQGEGGQFSGSICGKWENFPTQSPVCGGDDGLPTKLDGITFSKWRNESIKGFGNAVVPEIPYMIFTAINEFETLLIKQ